MISITNPASMEAAINAALDTSLHDRLGAYAPQFTDPALKDRTHLIVVQSDATEAAIADELGFMPLSNPMDGERYPSEAFNPYWDWLAREPGWFEMIIAIADSGFAFILLIEDADDDASGLGEMCRSFIDVVSSAAASRGAQS